MEDLNECFIVQRTKQFFIKVGPLKKAKQRIVQLITREFPGNLGGSPKYGSLIEKGDRIPKMFPKTLKELGEFSVPLTWQGTCSPGICIQDKR